MQIDTEDTVCESLEMERSKHGLTKKRKDRFWGHGSTSKTSMDQHLEDEAGNGKGTMCRKFTTRYTTIHIQYMYTALMYQF